MNPEIWRNVFDAIEDPAFLHDAQFCVLRANRAYCRAAGVTEAQALGKPYWEVFPPGTGPLPGCKEAMLGKGDASSREEVSVGAKLFLSKGYTARDDQGKYLYTLHLLSDISAQRQVTAALAESEERFRRATETARDAIITLDGESGVVTAWNPAAEVMFGYSKEEAIGRVLHDFLPPPRFREAATKGLAYFASTGEGAAVNQTLKLAALHKNGTEFPIELSLSAVQIHGKWHATGIARNITERKRAEAALKKSEARYRSFIEVTGQLAWVTGADGAVVEDIPPWRAFTGQSEEQVKGWGWIEALHPDDRERAAQIWREAVARKGVYEVEYRMLRHDGVYRDFFVRGVPVFDESGGVREWVGTSIDITERKRGEARIAYQAKLLTQVSDAIVASDEQYRITAWNAAAEAMYGWKAEEVLGRYGLEITRTEWAKADADEMRRLIEETGHWCGEVTQQRKDGTRFPVDISSMTLRDESGQITGYLSVNRDITERKQAEAKLAEQFNELQRWNEAMQGREMRILDLKHEVNELLGKSSLPPRYHSAESDGQNEA